MGGWARAGIANAPKPQEQVMATQEIFIRASQPISERDYIIGLIASLSVEYGIDYECYKAIIRCESNFRSVPNAKYGADYGLGPAQLIPSTARYCSEKLGREIDRRNIYDNLECGAWLKKHEGTHHWGTATSYMSNGEKWGSYECFKNSCL